MLQIARTSCAGAALALFAAALISTANAKQFTYSERRNPELAKKMSIPVFFAVPSSARAAVPADIPTSDILIDFKHPDAVGKKGDVGLRLVLTKRAGMAKRLGQSGLFQTGDILLTFRTEWGGAGAYPNVQMGISHTGIAYIKDGVLHNLDNPMSTEYLGPGYSGVLTSEHYRTLDYIHVIRPRGLTEKQRANILAWATLLNSGAKRTYPSQIAFNQDYNKPKIQSDKSLTFVKKLGQAGLGQNPPGPTDMYCSEFVWSVLAMKDCDPKTTADQFGGKKVPSCVKAPMTPLAATGSVLRRGTRTSKAGLADGPLMVIDALDLPKEERQTLIKSVFAENPKGLAKMSVGHRQVAEEMQPKFEKLQTYYLGVGGGVIDRVKASTIGVAFKQAIPENYSPTSFLINTLLPENNTNRVMDYVATIVIE